VIKFSLRLCKGGIYCYSGSWWFTRAKKIRISNPVFREKYWLYL